MAKIEDGDNGVLARMPGALIAEALGKMPPAETATDASAIAEVEVPEMGRVVVTGVLKRDPRWRTRFWTAVKAEAVP